MGAVAQGHINRMQQQVLLILVASTACAAETPSLSMFVGKYWLYRTGEDTVYGTGGGGSQDQDKQDGVFGTVGHVENETNYFIPASTFILNQSYTDLGQNISLGSEQDLLERATKTPPVKSTTETSDFLSKFLSIFSNLTL